MLAFVFWHHGKAAVEAAAYEASMGPFHDALRRHVPPGFRGSHVLRLDALPWLPDAGPVYEDWYLVDGFAALGALNAAAVDHHRRAGHDAVARHAAAGLGGVYQCETGVPEALSVRHGYWFSKPEGEPTDAFFDRLRPATTQPGAVLWRRQMNLGPAREFCLHAAAPVVLPVPVEATPALRLVWPPDADG